MSRDGPQAALRFERDPSGRTFLARQFTTYPFFCAAPFHLDRAPRGMLTAILQSSAGGLYEGERLGVADQVEDEPNEEPEKRHADSLLDGSAGLRPA